MEAGRWLSAHLALLVHLQTYRGQLSSLLALICRFSGDTWFTLKGSEEIYSGHIRKDWYLMWVHSSRLKFTVETFMKF
jgi:hypothetical protein